MAKKKKSPAPPVRLVIATQKTKKKRKRRRNRRSRRAPLNSAMVAFRHALCHPFSPEAVGARVPDSFTHATLPYRVATTISFYMQSSSSGNAELALTPSPCFSFINALTNTTYSGITGYSANSFAGGIVVPSALNSLMSTWRVVGWGVRLVLKDTFSNTQGRVYIATIPCPCFQPSYNILNSVACTNSINFSQNTIGFPLGQANAGNYLGLPTVQSYSMQQLLEYGSLEIAPPPSSAAQYEFHLSGESGSGLPVWSATQGVGDSLANTLATGAVATAGVKDATSLRGGSAVVMYFSGLEVPASGNRNVFDIDIVYHLEGVPTPVSALGLSSVPSAATIASSSADVMTGSTITLERELSRAQAMGYGMARFVVDGIADVGTRAPRLLRTVNNAMTGVMAGASLMSTMYARSRRNRRPYIEEVD